LSGPRYFSFAHRLPAYSGVMAARIEAQRDREDGSPQPATARPAPSNGKREVPLAAFMAEFPGMVSKATATPGIV
jgi:hypothetical protein